MKNGLKIGDKLNDMDVIKIETNWNELPLFARVKEGVLNKHNNQSHFLISFSGTCYITNNKDDGFGFNPERGDVLTVLGAGEELDNFNKIENENT